MFVYAVDRLGRDAIDILTTVRNLIDKDVAVYAHPLGSGFPWWAEPGCRASRGCYRPQRTGRGAHLCMADYAGAAPAYVQQVSGNVERQLSSRLNGGFGSKPAGRDEVFSDRSQPKPAID